MSWFILQLISFVELQSYIYRRLALMSLAHMAQDNWLVNLTCALLSHVLNELHVNSTYALGIKPCVKWATCAQILTNSS